MVVPLATNATVQEEKEIPLVLSMLRVYWQ